MNQSIQKKIGLIVYKYAKIYGMSDLTFMVVNKYCADGEDIEEDCRGCDNLHGPSVIIRIDEKYNGRVVEFSESLKKDPFFVKRGIPIALYYENPPWEMYI